MRKIFFNIQATNETIYSDPISMGCISDHGDIFYAEFTDFSRHECEFLIEKNTLPQLKIRDLALREKNKTYKNFYCDLISNNFFVEIASDRETVAEYLYHWVLQVTERSFLDSPNEVDIFNVGPAKYYPSMDIEFWGFNIGERNQAFILIHRLLSSVSGGLYSVYPIVQELATVCRIANKEPLKFFSKMADKERDLYHALKYVKLVKKCYDALCNEIRIRF